MITQGHRRIRDRHPGSPSMRGERLGLPREQPRADYPVLGTVLLQRPVLAWQRAGQRTWLTSHRVVLIFTRAGQRVVPTMP